MPDYVVIRLHADEDSVDWIIADHNGTRRSEPGRGTLEEAAIVCQDLPVIALVPATEVLTTTVSMPMRSLSKIRTALPFALEEILADDIATLHFAIGARRDDNSLPVAVVAHDKIEAWLERLSAVAIEPTKMVAENHGLAKIPGTLSMLISDSTVMFNDGASEDFVMQDVKPSDVLVMTGQLGERQSDEEDQSGHVVVFCTAEKDQQLEHDWIALRHELHSVDVNVLPDGVLAKLAVTVAAGHGINLLQGAYGKKTEYSLLFKPWKTAAIFLITLCVIGLASKAVDVYSLQREASALENQFTAEYRAIRPNDTRDITDPRSTVIALRRQSGTASGPAVFLPSLRELGSAVAGNSNAKIEAISYRAGVTDLRLTAPDVETLDKIQKAVSASGRFRATIQSTDQVADRIDGRIQIREAGQ